MELKLIEHLLCAPEDNSHSLDQIEPAGAMNDLVGTTKKNDTEAGVGDMRSADDDSGDRVILLTLMRVLSARLARCRASEKIC